jgi:hypothetical protein
MRQPRRRCPVPGTMVLCTYDAALPPARARSLSLKPPHSAARFLSVRADRPLACTRAARDSDVYSCGVDLNRPGPLESLSLGSTRKKKKSRNLTGRVASACNHALLRGRKSCCWPSTETRVWREVSFMRQTDGPKGRGQLVYGMRIQANFVQLSAKTIFRFNACLFSHVISLMRNIKCRT